MTVRTTWSHHNHTTYCDGSASVREMAEAAMAAGFTQFGISSHAPLPFDTSWNMAFGDLPAYLTEVTAAAREYRDDCRILVGAELDYSPDAGVRAFQEREIFPTREFDYFVGSVHFLGSRVEAGEIDGSQEGFEAVLTQEYGHDIQAMAAAYYQRIARAPELPKVRIIGHFDLIKRWNTGNRYFDDAEPWYRELVERAIADLAPTGVAIELNTAGWRKGLGEPYPAPWILERCRDNGIPITINADAHSTDQIDWGFERATELLTQIGISPTNPLARV